MNSVANSGSSIYRRPLAVLYGVVCHGLFLGAITSGMISMYHGMSLGLGPREQPWCFLWDLGLLLQFPLLHSFLLSRRGQSWLGLLAPKWAARDLVTTLFTMAASLQMLALYVLWAPLGRVWWQAEGLAKVVLSVAYGASWLVLAKAMADAGLASQTGFLGWSSLFRGRAPRYGPMPETGLFRWVRQPIYLGFVLIVWSVPVWTPDQLCLAILFTTYCLLGPKMKEARYSQRYGQRFVDYKARVPYSLPLEFPDAIMGSGKFSGL